jgi:putative N6-adenine-specific DNA methylase
VTLPSLLGDYTIGDGAVRQVCQTQGKDGALAREERVAQEEKAFLRHLKRHVQAPELRLAAIAPPELAPVCRDELTSLGFSDVEITDAGVEFVGKLRSCYLPNMGLRTASRILCRFPPFRAGAVEELFQRVSNCPWELWLNPEISLEVRAFVQYSRISHEGLIKQALIEGMGRRFLARHRSPPPCPVSTGGDEDRGVIYPPRQRLFIRLHHNQCEISLDTTGEHLHRRGYRLEHTGAPLRETLAAAILLRSQWRGEIPLIDGMCGAGTVAIEAALLARRIAPGLRRSFLCELWPGFEEKSWIHLRKKLTGQMLARSPNPILAIDDEPEALRIARRNAERAGVDQDIQWQVLDLFAFKPHDHQLPPGLLVLDPPYGKRIEGGGRVFYEQLGRHLRRFFEGWQTAILAPNKAMALSLKLPSMRIWQISHGGLPICVVMARL